MTDDLINPVLFYFLCGSLDVLITIIILFTGIGFEGNPLWNWITPKETLAIAIVCANLCLGIFIIIIAPRVSRYRTWKTVIKYGLYGEGLGRIAFGVVPGLLLMVAAGWI